MKKIFMPIHDALLMPLEGDINKFTSGVFDASGMLVEESMLDRSNYPAIPSPAQEKLNGTYIFGGYLFKHYGHFLLESLSRLYAIKTVSREIPILFMATSDSISAKYINILKILNVNNDIKIIKTPTVVDTLLVAKPGCHISSQDIRISDAQIKALANYNPKPQLKARFVWLSRSFLPHLGGVDNENVVETMLQEIGFEIVHPERLSILEQLEVISTARMVAGFSGSAFFTALLSKHIYGKFYIFSRTKRIAEPITKFLEAKGIEVIKNYPVFSENHGSGARARALLENPKEVFSALLTSMLHKDA